MHTLYYSGIATITSRFPHIIQTTVHCYVGSRKNCCRHAIICKGSLQKNYCHKSQHLKASSVTRLNMTSAYLPKNVNFCRKAQGRVCSVIDRGNYGAGNSILRKLENVQCPITKGGRVARAAQCIQHDVVHEQAYSRRLSVRQHRRYIKLKRTKDYFETKKKPSA